MYQCCAAVAAAEADSGEMHVDGEDQQPAATSALVSDPSDLRDGGVSDFGVPRLGSMFYDVIARQWCFAFDAQNGTPSSSAVAARNYAANARDRDRETNVHAGETKLHTGKLVQSSWAAAAKFIPQMLSTYLTLFSLLLHRRPLVTHPASSLLGERLPDATHGTSGEAESRRPADVALLSIQSAAAKAVLQLWNAAIAYKPVVMALDAPVSGSASDSWLITGDEANASPAKGKAAGASSKQAGLGSTADAGKSGAGSGSTGAAGAATGKHFLPPQVMSHLVSTLCLAFVSQADKGKPPVQATGRQIRSNMWGPAAAPRPAAARRPFVPSESTISSMSDQMGFQREQVEFVVNRLQTNEIAVLANYFLEHDVESMMRASQVSAARREAATTAVAAAVAAGAAADAGGAAATAAGGGAAGAADAAPAAEGAAAADAGAAGAAAASDEAEAMAVVEEEPDVLAQALKDSLHVASHQGIEAEAPEGLGLPDVASIGEGLLKLAMQQPQHMFVVCPLLQQAAEGALDQMLEWTASKIETLFPESSRTFVRTSYLLHKCIQNFMNNFHILCVVMIVRITLPLYSYPQDFKTPEWHSLRISCQLSLIRTHPYIP